MAEKQYLILLDIDARKRHYHSTMAGRITGFTVQLEVKVGGIWKEVVRYDCSHNYEHKDRYNIKGQCKKISLSLNYEDALTLTDDDINENWQIYKEKFKRGYFP